MYKNDEGNSLAEKYLSANLWEKVSFGESLEGNRMSSDEGDSLAEKYLQIGESIFC
jgi:hypothetical protein